MFRINNSENINTYLYKNIEKQIDKEDKEYFIITK